MGSLGETYGGSPILSDRHRLFVGTGLLLTGTVVAALGFVNVATGVFSALGLAEPAALKAGVALAALLVPGLFAGSLLYLRADRPIRLVAAGGLTAAVLAIALFLFTVPADAFATAIAVPFPIVGLYVLGAGVTVWAPIGAVAAAVTDDHAPSSTWAGVDRTSRTPANRRSPGGMPGGRTPADGGQEDDDLRFLLDDDDRRSR